MDHHKRSLTAIAALLAFGGDGLRAGADPREVLRQAMVRILPRLKNTTDYTCVETVDRSVYKPLVVTLPRACRLVMAKANPGPLDALHLFSTDRLRLDVTMTGAGETYSWAGASKFEDGGVQAVVRRGPIGSGAFGGFLAAIFQTDVTAFRFEQQVVWNGRNAMRFSFQTPLEESHYKMALADGGWAYVAYSGDLVIDEATYDPLQLRVDADDLPEAASACSISTLLNFEQPAGSAPPFLLPTYTRQSYLYPDGQQSVNAMAFASCREYRGESVITYGDGDSAVGTGASSASRAASAPPPLPAGIRFSMDLIEAIDTDHAATGDRFRGRLLDDLRDAKRRKIASKGGVVEGRLRRVERIVPQKQVTVVMGPTAIVTGDQRVRLAAVRDWTVPARMARIRGEKGFSVLLPRREEGPAGVFRFTGEHVTIPAKFHIDWVTVAMPGAAEK